MKMFGELFFCCWQASWCWLRLTVKNKEPQKTSGLSAPVWKMDSTVYKDKVELQIQKGFIQIYTSCVYCSLYLTQEAFGLIFFLNCLTE